MKGELVSKERIATVWSGYGEINRLVVKENGTTQTLVQKLIEPPTGRAGDESHVRKLKSYSVERSFYALLASRLVDCKVPKAHGICEDELILEDISIDYPLEDGDLGVAEASAVVRWAAHFHASLWSSKDTANVPLVSKFGHGQTVTQISDSGIWQDGSYWCLAVRQKELAALSDRWQRIAKIVDARLQEIPEHCKTIIHGDLKSANIAFSRSLDSDAQSSDDTKSSIAVYDFQWTGKGVGVRDLAYFFTSSVTGMTIAHESALLDEYYSIVTDSLKTAGSWSDDLERDFTRHNLGQWYAICLVDYYRFMLGWGTWGASLKYCKTRVETTIKEFKW